MDTWKKREVATACAAETDALDGRHVSSELAAHIASANPQTILMARELEQVITRALETLSEDLREVVLLRDMEGMRYAQIAEIVDCPVGTVKSRLNAARKRLQGAVLAWRKETEE